MDLRTSLTNKLNSQGPLALLVTLILAITGAFILRFAMEEGIGVSSDSIAYIGISENLVAGRGLTWLGGGGLEPVTHFPPLYPIVLAGLQLFGMEGLESARILNILLFGCNIFLIGLLVWQATNIGWITMLGASLAAFSPILIDWHTMAMTEPLYLFLGSISLFFLIRYQRTRVPRHLIISIVSISLTSLTRYAGLSLLATGTIAILLDFKGRQGEKSRNAIFMVCGGFLPLAVWMARNFVLAGTSTNRILNWHPPSRATLKRPLGIIWEWIFPFKFTFPALLAMVFVITMLILILIAIYVRSSSSNRLRLFHKVLNNYPVLVLIVYSISYSFLLLLTLTFLDASTPLDMRTTLPLYVPLGILCISSLPHLYSKVQNRAVGVLVGMALALLLFSYMDRSYNLVKIRRDEPRGYGSPALRDYVLKELFDLPPDTVFYTNNLEILYFFYGRIGIGTPIPVDSVKMVENDNYKTRVLEMRETLKGGNAVLVFFHGGIQEVQGEWVEDLSLAIDGYGVAVYTNAELASNMAH